MTPEAQRIAIAEACGWYDFGATAPIRGELTLRIIGRNKERMDRRMIPDYLTDLNAMHEAEKVLRPNDGVFDWPIWDKYLERLLDRTGKYDLAHATAAQRAEAFLRTLGKWKETP